VRLQEGRILSSWRVVVKICKLNLWNVAVPVPEDGTCNRTANNIQVLKRVNACISPRPESRRLLGNFAVGEI
jgi:hypothetical protein